MVTCLKDGNGGAKDGNGGAKDGNGGDMCVFTGRVNAHIKPSMSKTLKVALDRAYDDSKTVLPTEVARGIYIEHPPSAQALKLLHLMIAKAGGAMAEDRTHTLCAQDFRNTKGIRKHDKASLMPLFTQLRVATFHYDDPIAKEVHIGGFLDHATIDYRYEDETGEITVSWWFGGLFKKLAAESNHWAILDRQTVFSLKSKYSILLFQYVSSLVELKHKNSEIFTIPELRGMLGVPEEKLARWTHLNRDALKPAVAEVNQLARFTITAEPIKQGRHVGAVRITWKAKEDVSAVKKELSRPKVGRKARRDGTAQTPVVSFPSSGRVDGNWEAIARDNAPRLQGNHVPDLLRLSNSFRKWCLDRSISLSSPAIEKTFTTWCQKYSAR